MRSPYASKKLKHEIWPEFIAHFKSSTTKASYESDLDELMDYLKKDFLVVNEKDVESYFAWMQHKIKEGRLNSSTLSKKCRELHSLAEYICENKDKYDITEHYEDAYVNYLPYMTKQEKFASSVPVRHIDLLFKAAQKDTMAYCIIAMLYRAGMSSTEVCALRMDDFAIYDNGMFVSVKGRRELCYIPEDLQEILDIYIADRNEKMKKTEKNISYLFFNQRGRALNTMFISRMLKKYTVRAGIPAYSAQSIRNTCGFTLAAYGASDKQTARQLGVTTTQIHRYSGEAYRDNFKQKAANELVQLRVLPPDY